MAKLLGLVVPVFPNQISLECNTTSFLKQHSGQKKHAHILFLNKYPSEHDDNWKKPWLISATR